MEKIKLEIAGQHPGENILIASRATGWMSVAGDITEAKKNYKKLPGGNLVLTSNELWYHDIRIPLSEIRNAEISTSYSITGKSMKLIFHTPGNRYYRFRLNYQDEWMHQRAIPLTIAKQKNNWDIGGTILRILALAGLAYLMYLSWGKL